MHVGVGDVTKKTEGYTEIGRHTTKDHRREVGRDDEREKVTRHAHSMGPVTRIRRQRENTEKEKVRKRKTTERERETESANRQNREPLAGAYQRKVHI